MHHRIVVLSVVVAICGCTGDHSKGNSSEAPAMATGTPSACPANYLSVRLNRVDAGVGQRVIRAGIYNDSARSCVLSGYPGIRPLSAAGRHVSDIEVRRAAVETQTRPVELAPGAQADFSIAFGVIEGEPEGCPEATSIEVMPPDSETAIGTLDSPVRACGSHVEVTPLVGARSKAPGA